ncbi:MAG: hypothetical protein QM621_12880 [Aeromicrobium sp.]|uniref:hypothetical protein n=1 Tax=Aeromicrobium sp. TaxID=1871063 RepID=UPI0039E5D285
MKHSWKKMTVVAALTLTAGFGLAACDGDDAKSDDDKTGSESEGSEGGVELTADNFADRIGEAQLDAGGSQFELTVNTAGQEFTATGAQTPSEDPEEVEIEMSASAVGMDMEMLVVDGSMYMKMGEMTGGKYVQTSLDDPQYGATVEQLDLGTQLKTFEEALVEFEATGESEEIDGVDAAEYVLTLDSEKVMEDLGQDLSSLEGSGVELPETMEYTLFVGDDDLPRRMVANVDLGAGSSEMTMDFFDWGTGADVEAPSADEITTENPFAGVL